MSAVIDKLAERIIDLQDDIFAEDDLRFGNNADTASFVDAQKNANTKRMTDCHLRLFKEFLRQRSELRLPEDIPAPNLDLLLAQFFMNVRKASTSTSEDCEYEPGTLIAMHSSIHRYLSCKSYGSNIKNHEQFRHSRDVLNAKMKQLKSMGKGNKPNAFVSFTPDEMALCYEKQLLGKSNPQALLNTMWLNTTMHFGLRGRQEHTQMLWGDIQYKVDTKGQEYLEFNERVTKTRSGSTTDARPFQPKMFATGSENCPINIYKEYAARRPVETNIASARFYLQPLKNPKNDFWFANQPLGIHTIGNIAKNMAEQAGLHSTRKTNHSGRKTAIQTLLHSQVPPTEVMQLTGHKNIQSLNAYSHLSLNQQQSLSNIISEHTMSLSNQQQQVPQAVHQQKKHMGLQTSTDRVADEELRLLLLSDEFVTEMQPDDLATSTPTQPLAINKHITFANCTITGNITININQTKRKRDESDSEE